MKHEVANEESNILALANNAHLYISLRVMCGPCGAVCFTLTANREAEAYLPSMRSGASPGLQPSRPPNACAAKVAR